MNEQAISYLHQMANAARQQALADMPVIRLGELIKRLEAIEPKIEERTKKYGEERDDFKYPHVEFDFCGMVPTRLGSWRGVYAELALGYKELDYPHYVGLDTLLSELRSAIGKEFTGWKGGEYTMDENTPVWVANPGESGNTGIIGVYDNEYSVILLTAYIES